MEDASAKHNDIVTQQIDTIYKQLDRYRFGWTPPHPICSSQNVVESWKASVRFSGLEQKQHLILPGEWERVTRNIRTKLRAQDENRFDFIANQISTKLKAPYMDVRPLIPSYMDKDPSALAKLHQICCSSFLKDASKRMEESDRIGGTCANYDQKVTFEDLLSELFLEPHSVLPSRDNICEWDESPTKYKDDKEAPKGSTKDKETDKKENMGNQAQPNKILKTMGLFCLSILSRII